MPPEATFFAFCHPVHLEGVDVAKVLRSSKASACLRRVLVGTTVSMMMLHIYTYIHINMYTCIHICIYTYAYICTDWLPV